MSSNNEMYTPFESAIIGEEGFRDKSYKDTRGNRTIGYGFKEGPAKYMSYVDEKTALKMFREYYMPIARQTAANFVGPELFNTLDGSRQLALIDMAYNMGPAGLSKFKNVRGAVLRGDFETAGKEILNSKYAKQVPNRAKRNAMRLATGIGE
jgi:lysozyme